MKKRRVSVEELKKMGHMVVIWLFDEQEWCALRLRVDIDCLGNINLNEDVGLSDGDYNESGSIEEAMLRAELAYPGQTMHMVAYEDEEFCPPCLYGLNDEKICVYEVTL